MKSPGVVFVMVCCACGDDAALHDAGVDAGDGSVSIDAPPDGPPEVGFRISGSSIGVCRPFQLELATASGTQRVPVTQDGSFEFPHLIADGPFTVTAVDTTCMQSGSTTTNGADVTDVQITCDCVDALQDMQLMTNAITLGFEPEPYIPLVFTGRRWFLVDDTEMLGIRLFAAHPPATMTLNGASILFGEQRMIPYASGWTVSVSAAGRTRDYTFDVPAELVQDYIKAPIPQTVSGGIGFSRVAIDGDVLVVGAPLYGAAGQAFVYRRTGTKWAFEATLAGSPTTNGAEFGSSVGVSGSTIVVGAQRQGVPMAGAAYVFVFDGTTWNQQGPMLQASTTQVRDDEFGGEVSISGDVIAVGASGQANSRGAVFVFARSGTSWGTPAVVTAANAEDGDLFGSSVALSGTSLAVGAVGESSDAVLIGGPNNNNAIASGAVYVFVQSGATWPQQAYVKASNTQAGDQFGSSVAIDGDWLAVGAIFEDGDGTAESNNSVADSGAVYVYSRAGTTWSKDAYLKALNIGADDRFGMSAGIDRNHLVAGALREDGNAAGPGPVPDDLGNDTGAVYVFRRATSWSTAYYVKPSNPGNIDEFGRFVALDGATIVVGAPSEDSNSGGINGDDTNNSLFNAGAVYVFR